MNIYDVAHLAGVSTATVSRVINGGSVGVATKARVEAVLKKTGYQPSPYAQAMNSGCVKLVGVLVTDLTDLFYARAVAALEEQFRRQGYDMILYCVGRELEHIERYIDGLCSRKVDAIFTVGSVFRKVRAQLKAGDIPVITINMQTDTDDCYNVFCDDAGAVKSTVRLLYDKGHRAFLYLYDTDTASGTAKLAGFEAGLAACGLGKESSLVTTCPRRIAAAEQTAKRLLREHPEITAVITSVDELAVGTVKAAGALGRVIPRDLAVVGYDNSVLSECSTPRISTVDSKVNDLCTLGVNLFADLMADRPVARQYIVACDLIEKETT